MSANTLGNLFKITTFGESHGKVIGVVIDGVPAGLRINKKFIQDELNRRRPGRTEISTARNEEDKVEILSGVLNDYSTGAPICMIIKNKNVRSEDYSTIRTTPRPGHADLVSNFKYSGFNDFRGGGIFSGRITASFVMAGAIAKQILMSENIDVTAYTIQIGKITAEPQKFEQIKKQRDLNDVLCPDQNTAKKMVEEILKAKKENDSVGGIIQCVIQGVPMGVGEPIFSSIESELSKAIFSIPAVKGIEFGLGFRAAGLRGSQNNDPIILKDGIITTETNNSGGILGGISVGTPIWFNVAIKPTSSISKKQKTVDLKHMKETELTVPGRHDPCIVPRAVSVIESISAIVILDLLMQAGRIRRVLSSDIEDIDIQRRIIDSLTLEMLSLLKKRLDSAKIIGKIKKLKKSDIKDPKREKELLKLCLNYAEDIGLSKEVAKRFILHLIDAAINVQED